MVPIRAGDRFLLCSDGLSDYVTDEVIGETLRSVTDRVKCADELIRRTLQAGAPDNVSVIVCDVETA
jgi:protein phosphatase